ncbi:DNA repair exonuclease [Methanothermococcus sp.]|uniref:metallophosphoesterase family protein n=1 Tax=Methanothermococcus sp. TaxID=2614238 RepID=UPI0025F2B3D4|nr:DNA repair exonuclease [Methanothermococcus sp.]
MQFVHISDNHLGYRQYNLDERERDIYKSFNQCIDKIIEIKPDFVVHSGDLFESPEPSINAIYTAIEGFNRLKKYNIPIYIIHGNHDLPNRNSKGSPFKILKGFLGNNLKTFVDKKYHVFKKGSEEIFIGGSDFTLKSKINSLFDDYNLIERESKKYGSKILLFHQSIYSYSNLPTYELQLSNLPKGFNYYAGGHIHQRTLRTVNNEDIGNSVNVNKNEEKYGNGVIAYSGSTEILSYDEYRDYEKNGKGFYLVDMSGGDFDINDVDKIDIKCRDFIIDKKIMNKRDFENLINEMESKSNPVVICNVVKELFGHLHEILEKKALYSRLFIVEEGVEEAIIDIQNKKNIDEIFKEFLKNKNYDIDFVYNIFNKVLEDDDLYAYLLEYFNGRMRNIIKN